MSVFIIMQYGPTFDDGRGKLPDHIGLSVPRGMRAAIKRASTSVGMSSADFVRTAITEKLGMVLDHEAFVVSDSEAQCQ